jgi:hypothetical protein
MYNAVESENGVFVMRSQVHGGFAVPCAMKRRLGPDFKQGFSFCQHFVYRGHGIGLSAIGLLE